MIAVLAKSLVGAEEFEYNRLVQLGSVCRDLKAAADTVVFTDAAITRKSLEPRPTELQTFDLTDHYTDLTWLTMNSDLLRRQFDMLQYLTKRDRGTAMKSLFLAQPLPTVFTTVLSNLQELEFGRGNNVREHKGRAEKLILGLPDSTPRLRCLTIDRLDRAGPVPRALSKLQHLEELRIQDDHGNAFLRDHRRTPGLEELLSLSTSIRKLHLWSGSGTLKSSTLQELTLHCHRKLLQQRIRFPELQVFNLEVRPYGGVWEQDDGQIYGEGLLQVVNAILTTKRHSPKLEHLHVTILGDDSIVRHILACANGGASLVEEGERMRVNWARTQYVERYVKLDIALGLVSIDAVSHFKSTKMMDARRCAAARNDGQGEHDDDETL